MIVVALFLTLGALVASDPTIKYNVLDTPLLYKKFKADYNKKYSVEDETNRYQIFKKNLKKINELNAKSASATFGITKYSDLTREEFRAAISCLSNTTRRSVDDYYCEHGETLTKDAPDSWDWREHGKVTPVKDQGACGSCWAFSTIGNVEGVYAIKHNSLEVLSEQQLLDCDTINDCGCGGGLMDFAMIYLVQNRGSMTSKDYPYIASTQQCKFDASKVKANVVGCKVFETDIQDRVKENLYKEGPLSVAIDADGLQLYVSGILHEDHCPAEDINHGVLLVGYGSEKGAPYWILKNSWSSSFGENGYFRIARQIDENPCNIYGYHMLTVEVQ